MLLSLRQNNYIDILSLGAHRSKFVDCDFLLAWDMVLGDAPSWTFSSNFRRDLASCQKGCNIPEMHLLRMRGLSRAC